MGQTTRNCRRTGEEKAIHDRACRIRKMTDAQICDFINDTYNHGLEDGTKLAEAQQAGTPAEEGVRRFLSYLEGRTGSGNRIGKGTILYLTRELEGATAAGIFEEATP